METADRRNERFHQPGVEGLDNRIEELVATVVGLRGYGIARDRPGGVGRQQAEGPSRARTPRVECGLNSRFVFRFGLRFGGGRLFEPGKREETAE